MLKKPMSLYKQLCTPAKIYVVLSVISIISLFYQNYSDPKKYCVGMFQAKTNCNNKIYFLIKIVYMVFITYLLQMLCNKGYKTFSWILVLLPFVLMFIGIGILMIALIY